MVSAGELPPGTVLSGTYEIVRRLGMGGMGAVYEARHLRLADRHVAVKLLLPEAAENPEVFARFRREAEIGARLGHPNIIYVTDWDKLPNGVPFLVMEMLSGEDLAARLARGRISTESAIHILHDVASALMAAHKQGVVHRDLKPANIFLTTVGEGSDATDHVKVLDFGISKIAASTVLTREATVMGTPQYMSPEQAQGKSSEIDSRTDQFALATIAYEMFAGVSAFEADSLTAVLFKIVYEQPRPLAEVAPNVPPHVVAAIARGMAKDKNARFPDIASLVRALSVVEAPGAAPRASIVRPARKRSWAPAAIAAGVIAAATGAVILLARGQGGAIADHPIATLPAPAAAPAPTPAAAPAPTPTPAEPTPAEPPTPPPKPPRAVAAVAPPRTEPAPAPRPAPTPSPPAAADAGPSWTTVEDVLRAQWAAAYPTEKIVAVERGGSLERKGDDLAYQPALVTIERANQSHARMSVRVKLARAGGAWSLDDLLVGGTEEIAGPDEALPASVDAVMLFMGAWSHRPDFKVNALRILGKPEFHRSGDRRWITYHLLIDVTDVKPGSEHNGKRFTCEPDDFSSQLKWDPAAKAWVPDQKMIDIVNESTECRQQ